MYKIYLCQAFLHLWVQQSAAWGIQILTLENSCHAETLALLTKPGRYKTWTLPPPLMDHHMDPLMDPHMDHYNNSLRIKHIQV
jgi:hypothetical protein